MQYKRNGPTLNFLSGRVKNSIWCHLHGNMSCDHSRGLFASLNKTGLFASLNKTSLCYNRNNHLPLWFCCSYLNPRAKALGYGLRQQIPRERWLFRKPNNIFLKAFILYLKDEINLWMANYYFFRVVNQMFVHVIFKHTKNEKY